jgi:hypothetical protein
MECGSLLLTLHVSCYRRRLYAQIKRGADCLAGANRNQAVEGVKKSRLTTFS